jgi:hypothetical protein
MMYELTDKLGLRHENSTPYYPQANDQVEEINKILITMLRRIIGIYKTSTRCCSQHYGPIGHP